MRVLTALNLITKQFYAVLLSRRPEPTDEEMANALARLCKNFALYPARISTDNDPVFEGYYFNDLVQNITGNDVKVLKFNTYLLRRNERLIKIVQAVVGENNKKLINPG